MVVLCEIFYGTVFRIAIESVVFGAEPDPAEPFVFANDGYRFPVQCDRRYFRMVERIFRGVDFDDALFESPEP